MGLRRYSADRIDTRRNLMAEIVERLDTLIMVCDCAYDILAVNKAHADEFERLYQVRPKAGDNLLRLLADRPELQDEVRAGWRRALQGEESTFVEAFGDPARARCHYEVKFRKLLSDDGRLIGAYQFATDISARRQKEAELESAEEALRQSQKIEAIGQLTGGVAHDFNNLLTIIRSSVDYLRRPDLPEDRRRRYLDAASDTVDRATKLTGQLLAFARRQALTPVTFEVGEKLRGALDLLESVGGPRVQVRAELPDEACYIRADLSQFETALVNIVANARDAMDGEGAVTLRLSCSNTLPPIRGHAGADGWFACLSLTDTGPGIPADRIARIFEPFYTTKEVGKGTGLGLSQVFGFAKQSGGDVDVHSVPGIGTTITLYLPQSAGEVGTKPLQAAPTQVASGVGERILVVEDNAEVGRFSTEMLRDLGYRPVWARTGEEALDLLAAEPTAFDGLFTDVVMPGMGGLALAHTVRQRLPDLPVILTSGYSPALATDDEHGFPVVRKPYSAEHLSQVLHQMLSARREMTDGGECSGSSLAAHDVPRPRILDA